MVRVPKDQHAQLLAEAHVRPMDFTGRSLAGFVYLSAAGTASAAALRRWVSLAERAALEAPAAGMKPRIARRGRKSRPDRPRRK